MKNLIYENILIKSKSKLIKIKRKKPNLNRYQNEKLDLDPQQNGQLNARFLVQYCKVEPIRHWWALSPKGGRTAITIKPPINSEHPVEYTGEVHCSLIDSYVRKYGVKRAMAIAYSNYLKANDI